MKLVLTEQQQQAIDAGGETPPCMIDPRDNTSYYLVPASDYETMRELIEEERRERAIRQVGMRNAGRRIAEGL